MQSVPVRTIQRVSSGRIEMECILCGRTIPGSAAFCDACAAANLNDDWYVDSNSHESTRRLMMMTDAVAVLDGNSYTVTLDGDSCRERFDSLPDGAAGYTAACDLFNGLMVELGQEPERMDFTPPPFTFLKEAIRKLDRYEIEVDGGGEDETYDRMASLYESASAHLSMPFVSSDFAEYKKSTLVERAAYWKGKSRNRVQAGGETEAAPAAVASDAVIQEHATPLAEPQTDDPSASIGWPRTAEETVEAGASGQVSMNRTGEAQAAEAAVTEKEPRAVNNGRKRAYLHYLSYSFDRALAEIIELIQAGVGTEHDYALASILSLRTGKYAVLDALKKSASSQSIGFEDNLLRAVGAWKDGSWGRALQLTGKEMNSGSYSAGLLLKKSICEQYGLREKFEEIKRESALVTDLQKGIDILSSAYLAIGTWGAALQTMSYSKSLEWSADTWTNMGMALEEKGEFKEAAEAYDKALEMNALLLPAIVRRGLLQCKLGKHSSALETLKRAEQLEPSVFRLQAAELVELGRKAEAVDLLAKLLDEDPDDGEAATLGLRLSMELELSDREKFFRAFAGRRDSGNGLQK